MLFNSWQFVVLVIVTFCIYYLPLLRPLQRMVLVAASMIFYGAHHPLLLTLLVGSILTNVFFRYILAKQTLPVARVCLSLGVSANLGILGVFKYSGLLAESILKPFTDRDCVESLMHIPLPIGISFFTFQGISLLVDTFRARTNNELRVLLAEKEAQHWLDVTLFISFFPQLVAGPIVKAHEFLPQIKPRLLRDVNWTFVFHKLAIGYFLKMVVADNLKTFTQWIEYPVFHTKSTLTLLTMLFGYSMQIFADFAGYSLIAIGGAAIYGYRLKDNFDFPYISASFAEFWRRWHISLSSFLREYLYIPLGGNRKGGPRTYFNLMITMLLGGFWHGAAWSYAVWGFAHGVALAAERFISGFFAGWRSGLPRIAAMMFVFTYVTFAWLLFKLPNFDNVIEFFQALTSNLRLRPDYGIMLKILLYSSPVMAYHLYHCARHAIRGHMRDRVESLAFGTMLFLIATNSGPAADFIYFQF